MTRQIHFHLAIRPCIYCRQLIVLKWNRLCQTVCANAECRRQRDCDYTRAQRAQRKNPVTLTEAIDSALGIPSPKRGTPKTPTADLNPQLPEQPEPTPHLKPGPNWNHVKPAPLVRPAVGQAQMVWFEGGKIRHWWERKV
jgi:hypothetical protein